MRVYFYDDYIAKFGTWPLASCNGFHVTFSTCFLVPLQGTMNKSSWV
jgi:hypothetical protein